MEVPTIKFETIKSIEKFVKMNRTDTANYYTDLMKDTIKIIGKEQDVYYYDSTIKLWKCETKQVYDKFIADFLNETGKNLMKAFNKLKKDDDDDDDDDDDESQSKKLKKLIKTKQNNFDSDEWISAIIKRSTGGLQNNQFVTLLNASKDYLAIRNGKKINLMTGEVTDRNKLDYFSYECNVELTKKTEHADKFFNQVMPKKDNREYLRKVLGYCLTGNMDARVFFIWYGDGSNAKSVIMRILKCILGPLYHQCSKGIFMKGSQEKTEGASPDKIALIGVRNATYSEGETADDIDVNESFIKMVVGKDEINARGLYKAPLTFLPICKLNLLTNYKPDLNGDKSMRERVRYLFLDSSFVDNPDKNKINEFKKDEGFIDSLCEDYLSEVFTWIVKGSIEYYKTKTIIPTEEFQQRTDKFFEGQDSITSFLKRKIEITNDDKDYKKKGELFELYKTFCTENSQRCHPRSTLFKRLDDLKIRISALHGYDVYRGIKIVDLKEKEINDEDYDNGVEKVDFSVKLTIEEQIEALQKTIKQLQEKKTIKTKTITYYEEYTEEQEEYKFTKNDFDIKDPILNAPKNDIKIAQEKSSKIKKLFD